MTTDRPKPPASGARPAGQQPAPEPRIGRKAELDRRAAALRENLKRRKAQSRARAAAPPPDASDEPA